MALRPCRECRRDISSEATSCPHCGAPRPTEQPTGVPPPPQLKHTTVDQLHDSKGPGVAATILGWVVGAVIGLLALGALVSDALSGAILLLAATVVLPPVNHWLRRKLGIVLSWKAKTGVVIGLIIAASVAGGLRQAPTSGEDAQPNAATEAQKAALRAEYDSNSAKILRQMDSAYAAKNYGFALLIGQKYREAVADTQLLRRLRAAHDAQKREADRAKERQLLAQVAMIPASNVQARRDIYQQLVALNPSNATYKQNFADYDTRIRREVAAVQDRIRRFGPVPEASAWDGTYREVKDYLKATMNDPSSLEGLECTQVHHVDRGWLVGCNYRGRNAFGGMIRTANWFIIRNRQVVEMLPFSAYRP